MDEEEENSYGLESMRIRLAVMKVREQEYSSDNSCTKDRFILGRNFKNFKKLLLFATI